MPSLHFAFTFECVCASWSFGPDGALGFCGLIKQLANIVGNKVVQTLVYVAGAQYFRQGMATMYCNYNYTGNCTAIIYRGIIAAVILTAVYCLLCVRVIRVVL